MYFGNDVVINAWERPWNAKRNPKKNYRPENDPYALWAETDIGLNPIGFIYSGQGFEFDNEIWFNGPGTWPGSLPRRG